SRFIRIRPSRLDCTAVPAVAHGRENPDCMEWQHRTGKNDGRAMPLLKKASHVVVLTVQGGTVPGPTGEELARYLHRNGVLCEPITVQPEDRSTGEAILAHATSLRLYPEPVATDDFRRSHPAHLGKCVPACLDGALITSHWCDRWSCLCTDESVGIRNACLHPIPLGQKIETVEKAGNCPLPA